MIKKTSLAEYAKIRANGLIAINLVDGDELQWVGLSDGQSDIILPPARGRRRASTRHEVRPMGRDTQGVTGIRLKRDDEVIGMEVVELPEQRAPGRHRAGLRQAHRWSRTSRSSIGPPAA